MQRAFGAEGGVDADGLRVLFQDFDGDQDGRVSLAEFEAGLVVREWHLIDDVATWMQVLAARN